jgi:hydrogenase nickel incorporation protein HypA/HybF
MMQLPTCRMSRMHELAITESIVEAISERAAGSRVVTVRLRVGKLTGVVPDALRFCFEIVAADTPLAGATLEIDEILACARCLDCRAEFELHEACLLCCCGSANLHLLSGQELKIQQIEVVDNV